MSGHNHCWSSPTAGRPLLRRLGWGGFLFFLIKGIAWLALGAWFAL